MIRLRALKSMQPRVTEGGVYVPEQSEHGLGVTVMREGRDLYKRYYWINFNYYPCSNFEILGEENGAENNPSDKVQP